MVSFVGVTHQGIKVEEDASSAQPALPWHFPTFPHGTSPEDPIDVDADDFTRSYFVPLASNKGTQPTIFTNGAVGLAPAGHSGAAPCHAYSSSPYSSSPVSGSLVTSPQRRQVMQEDGRTNCPAIDHCPTIDLPVLVPGSWESFSCESATVENSPTRYQQFRREEPSDSATTDGGDAVASSRQACSPGNEVSRRSFATFDEWEEGKGKVRVQVVTTRDEIRSELPAATEDDPALLADNNNEPCRESSSGQAGPHPVLLDTEDNQWQVEAVLKERRGLYLVKWVGCSDRDNTWLSPDDIHPDLVKGFDTERRRKRESAREAKRRGRVYKMKRTGGGKSRLAT